MAVARVCVCVRTCIVPFKVFEYKKIGPAFSMHSRRSLCMRLRPSSGTRTAHTHTQTARIHVNSFLYGFLLLLLCVFVFFFFCLVRFGVFLFNVAVTNNMRRWCKIKIWVRQCPVHVYTIVWRAYITLFMASSYYVHYYCYYSSCA